MDVLSLCPLRALGFVWQPRAGTCAQTVVVKATFRLVPGEAVLAEAQDAPGEEERRWDEGPSSSVRVPSDGAPYKARADVVLVGHAYAPGKQPSRSWMARLVVGELDKSIEVWCDRGVRWQDGQLLEGPRVTKVPLRWERAAGGPETNNPVGMRFDAAPDRYGMVPIPNLQPPGMFVASRADTFAPACFGPIAPEWPRVSARLGRLGPGWNGRPFPEGFDYGTFQVAPPDQQVAEIRANERIVLENLHPEHARLVTSLPGLRPRAVVDRATGEREEVGLVADTLWIDTDRGVCCVVWRGRIGLRHAAEAGRIAVWVEGMPLVEVGREVRDRDIEEDDGGATMTLVAPLEKKGEPALPFVPGLSRLSEPERRELLQALSRWAGRESGDGSETVFAPMARPAGKALPFEGAREVAEDDDGDMAKTLPPMGRPAMMAAPFVLPSVPMSPPVPVIEELADREEAPGPLPAPPPMIGPLATAEMVQAKLEEKAGEAKETASAGEKEAAPVEVEEEGVDLSIEETAAIAAEIAEGKVERATVLEARELSERAWKKNVARWDEAMEEEQGRGRNALRGAYDAAYVERVEGFRGVITVEEYARILVGMERGRVEGVLDAMGIQRAALMPIVRVWARKVARDGNLAVKSMRAVRDMRAD
ncbi:DUF2169 family type VI secretion system accessory protein [Polyangium fumosum]|uniref:DUF2169 domain-containing protein n=1 Tax=Polyangium fumosum TaxID=889272 RepID=A0A4U1J5E8_9BACT|nr:DUF2169 domain-containing protein [Polyangium fumosum]TKD02445.1 DUF2169 domain-containing protein [Polyangium fumosum]